MSLYKEFLYDRPKIKTPISQLLSGLFASIYLFLLWIIADEETEFDVAPIDISILTETNGDFSKKQTWRFGRFFFNEFRQEQNFPDFVYFDRSQGFDVKSEQK